MRILTEADVGRLLTPDMAIRSAEQAYAVYSGGLAQIPPRSEIHRTDPPGTVLVMPGLIGNSTLGVKLIGSVVSQSEPSRRHTTCIIMVWDAVTLVPRGMISADELNDYRTAGGLAVGARLLARADSSTHVLFGTGKLAFPTATYTSHVLPIRRVIVVGRTVRNVDALIARLKQEAALRDTEIVGNLAPDEAVAQADIITTITRSAEPLFDGRRIRQGTHINIAGAMRRNEREVDDHVARRAIFVLDSEEMARQRAGDLALPLEAGVISEGQIAGEIGDIILGNRPGRTDPAQITIFRSMGIASQDLCLAAALLDEAESKGVGQEIAL